MSENNGLASWQRAIQQLSEYNPDEYSATYNMGQEILRREAKVKELESQLEQAKKEALSAQRDQARYKFVRDMSAEDFEDLSTINEFFDSAIDAAMQEGK